MLFVCQRSALLRNMVRMKRNRALYKHFIAWKIFWNKLYQTKNPSIMEKPFSKRKGFLFGDYLTIDHSLLSGKRVIPYYYPYNTFLLLSFRRLPQASAVITDPCAAAGEIHTEHSALHMQCARSSLSLLQIFAAFVYTAPQRFRRPPHLHFLR